MSEPLPAPKYTAWFCSHTHWDREWYGSFQQFRYRLVRLVDNLLDMLESNPKFRCFNLDGQTIVLEDYLEIRPEQRQRLEGMIRQGRILIGPWYILPDEWLVSGESTIRNWIEGRDGCRRFGVEPPNVGYLPDMFGHLSQIPQILQGLGMDNTIFWRGLTGDDLMTELWWEGADGSRVFGIHLPEYCGYCNAAFFYGSVPPEAKTLPPDTYWGRMMYDDPEFVLGAMESIVRRAQERSMSGQLLMMNGVDHLEPDASIPALLQQANDRYPEVEFRHGTFAEFMAAAREKSPADLQVVKGEHRSTSFSTGMGAIILPNILSSRIYLKIANMRCQTLLERWVEPFGSAVAMIGGKYPAAFIRNAWKMLLKNHPHDSIGGCSIDEVHVQMEARFREIEDIATVLREELVYTLAQRVDTSALGDKEAALMVFNPLAWPVSDTVRLRVELEEAWFKAQGVELNPEAIYRSVRNLKISEWGGEPVECVVENIEYLQAVHRPWLSNFEAFPTVVRFTVSLAARDLPPLGYRAYRVSLPPKLARLENRHGTGLPTVLQNEYLTAEFAANGTVNISGPLLGRHTISGLHYFEDDGDNGDGYTYSPPRHDAVVTSVVGAVQLTRLMDQPAVQAVALDYEMNVPEALAPDRQRRSPKTALLKVRSVFRLGRDSRRLDVETIVTNVVSDHRLRVCFPIQGSAETHVAESQFDVIERRNHVEQPPEEVWIEDQPLERANTGFVSFGNCTIANFGLPEYETVPTADGIVLKLTLFRAANWLGAGQYPNTIFGGAGPHIETPDQQMPGRTLTFNYSIIPHKDAWDATDAQRQSHQHNAMWHSTVTGRHAGELRPNGESFISVKGDGIMLSAVKRMDNPGNDYLVRIWNSGTGASTATVTWKTAPSACWLASLAEVPGEALELDQNSRSVFVPVPAKGIVTVGYRH